MRNKTLISKFFCLVIILKHGKVMGVNTDSGDLKMVHVNANKPHAIHVLKPATNIIRLIPLGLVGTRAGRHLFWPGHSDHVPLPKCVPW